MATEKARIEAELVGGQQVEQGAARMDAALGKVGTTASSKLMRAAHRGRSHRRTRQ